ncbi:tRNA lysidine(34) synthetase TilS [Georgenia sp. Z1344]|uniref:tRNA lysidine(34) synthetase TilS n=1 Tax=Georgenia sp. Z1344 TaxID=3416706 RepID=UPI003CF93605
MTRHPRVSGPATLAARRALRTALADLPPGTRVLVACSGGPDSLALAVTVAHLVPEAGWVAEALVVDHGLRAGSAGEASDVVARLRAVGLAASATSVDAGSGTGGPEARARDARWAALRARAAAPGGAAAPEDTAVILTGHTMDDQAETVLLGLARGSGARSLAGMRAVEPGVRRPFLTIRRAQTLAVCDELGLTPVIDPTNAADGPWRAADGTALRRAAVRDRALPALADALGADPVPALARTAFQARRDDDALTERADALLADALLDDARRSRAATRATDDDGPASSSDPVMTLDTAVLAAAHPAVRTRALRAAGERAGWRPGDVKAAHLEALDALVTRYTGQGPAALPGGVLARRCCGRLMLSRRTDQGDEGATWT